MTYRTPSSLALGILSSVVLLGLNGCASTKCPDPIPNPAEVQLKIEGKKVTVTPRIVCVKSGGTVRFILPDDTKLELSLNIPGLPPLNCMGTYCDLGPMPIVIKEKEYPYTGGLLSDGKLIPFDPAIRILP